MKKLTQFRNTLHWGKRLGRCLCAARHLQNLVALAIMMTVTAGLLLFLIDPNIHSWFDGMWAAWVTITHVGFGDVVPSSFFGRLLAAGLILLGLALLSLFTALVSATLINNAEALSDDASEGVGALSSGETLILAELSRVQARLDYLEKQLGTLAASAGKDPM